MNRKLKSLVKMIYNYTFRSKAVINKILAAKLREIEIGADGFMVYDTRVVPYVNEVRNLNTTARLRIECSQSF